MKKFAVWLLCVWSICLFSACGAESAASTAETTTAESTSVETAAAAENAVGVTTTKAKSKGKSSANAKTVTAVSPKLTAAEITAVSLTYSAEGPLTLDLEEKQGPYAAHVEASGYVGASQIRIYTEDESLAEVSDITVKESGLVNFSLTGKTAGSGKLYLATADGTLVSEPVEIVVRTPEEKADAERPIYYTPLGEYWHFSEACAREDYPGVTYDWKGNQKEVDRSTIRVLEMPQGTVMGDKKACPKCAAEESAQQDGE